MRYLSALVLVLLACSQAFGATCVVTEHSALPRDAAGQIMQVPTFPPLAVQAVTYTSSTATANPFGDATRYIGIVCDAKAHFEVAADGAATATASDPWVPADTWFFIEVDAGQEIAFYDGAT